MYIWPSFTNVSSYQCFLLYSTIILKRYFSHTGLFEEDPVVTVTQWNGVTSNESPEGPLLVDATCVNDSQPSMSLPASSPSTTVSLLVDGTYANESQPSMSSSTTTASTTVPTQPMASGSSVPYDPTELHLCKKFIETTCGCKKANGKPCSSLFPLDHYIDLRAQSSLLTHDELDLVLLGCIMCTVLIDQYIRDGRHKPVKRRRTTITFMHHAHEVCKTTFGFLYGVGRRRIMALKESYLLNGLETRIHGNTKRLPHNQMTHRAICNVVKFLQNYAEQNAILLPGRLPNYKKDDIKLLPSSCSKKVFLSLLVVNR